MKQACAEYLRKKTALEKNSLSLTCHSTFGLVCTSVKDYMQEATYMYKHPKYEHPKYEHKYILTCIWGRFCSSALHAVCTYHHGSLNFLSLLCLTLRLQPLLFCCLTQWVRSLAYS